MLENQDQVKTGPIRLRVTERIRQDCVYMVHGFGREDARLRRGLQARRRRLAPGHAHQARPGHGRHGHERQLRHRRPTEGGLRWPATR